MPANEKGRLFGAITSKDIVKVVREELKTEITKHQLKLAEQIKTVGRYEAKISLHGEVEADLIIEVE
ncbi:MAG TPA: 50S ribosomal protein L9, partial [Actinobacteria bacterium]|nr:50S ribosomal protein L9 [Actinomycetes bacterium]HEX21705.1 50S ribosomal protein L9 [Actinomycetota bacterium]